MRIGMPCETKPGERRVALLPAQVRALCEAGHDVCFARGAGEGAGATDAEYAAVGASLVSHAESWDADLIVRVKELQPADREHLPPRAVLFSFHQLPNE